jgi:hypothetical protein
MAHYAWINADNVVVNVTVGVDETITQQGVGGSTEAWEQFYTQAINQEGVYVKRTSYHGNIRKQFCGVGFIYLPDDDVFVAPQPYPSWILDANHDWQPPIPRPADASYENPYEWNEEELEWVAI